MYGTAAAQQPAPTLTESKTIAELLLKPLTLRGHTHLVASVAISRDGKRAVSGGGDNRLCVWNLEKGLFERELKGHTGYIHCVALSRDGKRVVSGSADKTLRVWQLETGACELVLKGHSELVASVALSRDGKRAVSGGGDNRLCVWNLESGLRERELQGHTTYVASVVLSRDGKRAVSGSEDALRVWNLETGLCERELKGHTSWVSSVALSRDGKRAVSGDGANMLLVWNLETGACERKLEGHSYTVLSVALSFDAKRAVSGSADKTLRVWNLETGDTENILYYQTTINSIVLYPHANYLYALTGLGDGTLDLRPIFKVSSLQLALPPASQVAQDAQLKPLVSLHPNASFPQPSPTLPTRLQYESKATRDNDEIAKLKEQIRGLQQQTALKSTPLSVAADSANATAVPPSGSQASTGLLSQTTPHVDDKKDKHDIALSVSFRIDYNTLTLGKELGRGGFGVVYAGTWRHADIAIKQLLIDKPSEDLMEEFESEIQAMAKLRSPYIVQFYGYCVSPRYSIIMEYLPKGSLFSLIRSKAPLDWNMRFRIATEMACGLSVLHYENILHRDIKSLNVLLDDNLHAKLTDFGLSKIKNETRTSTKSVGGTLQWMAPELFSLRPKHTKKSDIYSLAITFWELVARQIPYQGADPGVVQTLVQKGEREEIPADCPKKFATLIQACWEGDPTKRPDCDAVVAYLKSEQQDFQVFLPGFLASRSPSVGLQQTVVGNLHSSANAGANASVSANTSLSFKRVIVGNLASG